MWDNHTLTPASSSKLSLALFFANIMAPLRSAAGHQFVDKLSTDLRAGRDLLKLLLAASYELLRWKCSVGASQQVFMMSPKAVAGSWATPVSLWVPRVETGRKRERESAAGDQHLCDGHTYLLNRFQHQMAFRTDGTPCFGLTAEMKLPRCGFTLHNIVPFSCLKNKFCCAVAFPGKR